MPRVLGIPGAKCASAPVTDERDPSPRAKQAGKTVEIEIDPLRCTASPEQCRRALPPVRGAGVPLRKPISPLHARRHVAIREIA